MKSARLPFNSATAATATATATGQTTKVCKVPKVLLVRALTCACACALALPLAATAQTGMSAAASPSSAPAAGALAAPADERVAFTWGAAGTQNYECKANDKGAFAWVFAAPEADLFAADKAKVGTHGAGPFWLAMDSSKVNGRVKARADAPAGAVSGGAIPWLLLATQSTGGAGKLAAVTHIQRINTAGGLAPASGCASAADAGQLAKVGYAADYVFFVKR